MAATRGILSLIAILFIIIMDCTSDTITDEDDSAHPISVSFFSEEGFSGIVEKFSVFSDEPLTAVRPLGSSVYVMGLDEVKSISIPRGVAVVVYKSETIKRHLDDSVPDAIFKTTEAYLPAPLDYVEGGYAFVIESTLCDPPCSVSGGICTLNEEGRPYCKCALGFEGEKCDNCLEGHYGEYCKKCKSGAKGPAARHSNACDQGIHGTGMSTCEYGYSKYYRCKACDTGFSPGPNGECIRCNCGKYGKCINKSDECACLEGRLTLDPKKPCEACAPGTFKTPVGCEACWGGCKECSDSSGECVLCHDGYKIDPSDKRKCVLDEDVNKCPKGTYFDRGNCLKCHPSCKSCYNHSRCEECAGEGEAPLSIALSNGTGCAKIAQNEGIKRCVQRLYNSPEDAPDQYAYSTSSIAVYNEKKNVCELCGTGCSSCNVKPGVEIDPNDSEYSSKLLLSMECNECVKDYGIFEVEGRNMCHKSICGSYFVRNHSGECVDPGAYNSAINSSIKLWEENDKLLKKLKCTGSTYPSLFLECATCHPDCKTCTGPGSEDCTSCNPGTVLQGFGCVRVCKEGYYEDRKAGICSSCVKGCRYCTNAEMCLECDEGYVLDRGACQKALYTIVKDNRQTFVLLGYASASLAGLLFVSTGVIKMLKVKRDKIEKKYSDWGKRTADSRMRVLASTGALQNIGIGTDFTDCTTE